MNKKLGCLDCRTHRCARHGVTPSRVWWHRYVEDRAMQARHWLFTLIKKENK